MKLFTGKSVGLGIVIGLGAAVVLPVAYKVASGALKPLLKEGIKGGMVVADKGKLLFAEAKEALDDLSAEAKAELAPAAEAPKGKAAATAKK